MPDYCTDKKKRDWMLGHDVCDGDNAKCNHKVMFGKQEYCGYCPPRCGLHQIVKSQAGCIWCKYYVKDLNSSRCLPCLSAETRINYERCKDDLPEV